MARVVKDKSDIPQEADLYSHSFKIGVQLEDYDHFRQIELPRNVSFFPVTQESGKAYFGSSKSSKVEITHPIINLIGFAATSKKGLDACRKLSSEFPEYIELEGDDSFVLVHDDKHFQSWLLQGLVGKVSGIAQRNAKLSKQLSVIRKDYEEMEEAFRLLERSFSSLQMGRREQALVLPETEHVVELIGGKHRLIQRLPTSSTGISDIAIHLQKSSAEKSKLIVSLFKVANGETIADWQVSNPKQGWIRLSLNTCLGVRDESIGLAVETIGRGKLILSLSVANPVDDWCATLGSRSCGRSLACKVWRGVPGTSPMLPSNVIPHEKIQNAVWQVPAEVLEGVENRSHHPDYVKYLSDRQSILVHPLNDIPVVGVLKSAITVDATHISTEIEHVNAEGRAVEFCIAVSKSGGEKARTSRSLPVFKNGYMSDWQPLSPGQKSEIHLYFPIELKVDHDVYLMTKIGRDVSNENCWAHFTNIKIYNF